MVGATPTGVTGAATVMGMVMDTRTAMVNHPVLLWPKLIEGSVLLTGNPYEYGHGDGGDIDGDGFGYGSGDTYLSGGDKSGNGIGSGRIILSKDIYTGDGWGDTMMGDGHGKGSGIGDRDDNKF